MVEILLSHKSAKLHHNCVSFVCSVFFYELSTILGTDAFLREFTLNEHRLYTDETRRVLGVKKENLGSLLKKFSMYTVFINFQRPEPAPI